MSSSPKSQGHSPFTIPTLLSSLQEHLQEQTSHLPILHAQLGLPQSALIDELSSLHQRLTTCVEDQIELRRQEVDEWMKRCDVVERECSKYTKTLGANTKILSTSLGELKKQKALPVRHEMLNQYLEKLDHLYRSKLEQVSNLNNRIAKLAETLGSDFFAVDVVDATPAYGESPEDKILRDVTPERFSKLEKECARGRTEISRRLHQLAATFLHMDWLYQELGISPPSDDSDPFSFPSSSSSTLKTCQFDRSSLNDDPFTASTSTPTPCPRGKRNMPSLLAASEPLPDYGRIYTTFIAFIDELESEGKDIDEYAMAGLEGVEPSVGLVSWAEETKAELDGIKVQREAQIQSMYDQLEPLWKRLGVEDEDIDGFVDNNRGSTVENVRAYEQELERMMELKSQSMSIFIGNARVEIEALWEEMMFGEDERAEFSPYTDDEYTENLLMAHEEEIRRLKEERKAKAPILARLQKYFEICDGEKELVAAAQDQSRLLGRGPRDPGRLLREEKMRKRVKREKPKLEQELMSAIPTWEEEEGRPFLVNGERIIEVLECMGAVAKPQPKQRAGSVPLASSSRSGAPPSALGTAVKRGTRVGSAEPAASGHSAPPSTNKRQRVVSTNGKSRAVSSSSSGPEQEEHNFAHRAPFGSRSGALNASTASMASSNGSGVPMTAKRNQAQHAKTPSANSSTLPRPTSAASRTRPTPGTQKKITSGGIGLGRAPSSVNAKARAVSASAASNKTAMHGTFGSIGKACGRNVTGTSMKMNGRSTLNGQGQIKKGFAGGLPPRNSRRESFRPRASVVEPRYVAYGKGGMTDDEY